MNISILVATHKPFWVPPDSVYFPIHVGAIDKPSIGYIRDDMGENISAKNPYYNELTALYWGWKHKQEDDYLGLCRFRRYLGKPVYRNSRGADAILNRQNFEEIFQKYDCIVPKKRRVGDGNLQSQYAIAHHAKDLMILEQYVKAHYPEYRESFKMVMNATDIYSHNVFVLRKDLFNQYCEFLFSILFGIEPLLDTTGYSAYEQRVFSFMGEILFNVWFMKHQPRSKEVLMLYLEQVSWGKRIVQLVKDRFLS